jgi:GAF domain-containing protein/ActR/RegA family two-component response regulator
VRSRQFEALYAVSVSMGAGADLSATARETLDVARALARMEAGVLYRLDPDTGGMTLIASRGVDERLAEGLRQERLDRGLLLDVARGGRHRLADPMTRSGVHPVVRELARSAGYRSELALPIAVEGRPWGAMALLSTQARTLDDEELTLLIGVAHQAGLAVGRAELFAETREKTRRLEALTRLAQTLTATLTLEDVLQQVVDAVVALFGIGLSRLWLVDDDGAQLSVRASAGARSPSPSHPLRVGEGLMGRVVATRTPLSTIDVLADGRAVNVEHIHAEGIRSFAGVPMIAGDRVLGALYIATREPRQFSAEDVSLLQSLANHGAIAITNARLYAQAQARGAHLAALLEINKKISALAPADALLTSIAEEAARLLDVDNAGFRLVEGDDLVLAGLAGTAGETMIRPRVKVGESFSGRVVAERRPLIVSVDQVAGSLVPEHLAADRRLGYTNFLGVPIRVAERVIGVLAFRARRPFTTEDQTLAEAFASQAAVALENTRLYQEIERGREAAEARARRLATLSDVTRLMNSAAPREEVFQAVAKAATTLLGAKAARVWVDDPATGALRSRGGVGADQRAGEILAEYRAIPHGIGLIGAIFRSGRPEYVPDIVADSRLYNRRLVSDLGLHAFMGLPLATGDRMVGVLSIMFEERRVLTIEDRELANLLANQAAIAISNASLYEAIELRASRLRTLAHLSQLVSSSLDPSEVLTGIARAAAQIMQAPFVAFWLADHATQTLELRGFSEPILPADFGMTSLAFGQGAVGWVAAERTPLEIEDIFADGRFQNQRWARHYGFRSFFGIPIVFRETLLGVLVLVGHQPFRFSADDRELLDTFVGHAATAMRNADLYREARDYAERLRAVEEVNRLVSSSLNVDEVLHNIARAVARFFDAPYVSVWVFEPARGRLRRSLVHGDEDLATTLGPDLGLGEGAVGWVALHQAPILWTEIEVDGRITDAPRLLEAGLRYLTAYPISIGDRVLGAFSVSRRVTPSPLTPETASLLASLAAQAAVALDHARLYSETLRRLEETAALLEVAEILGSTLDAKQLLKRVAMKVAQVCHVDRCSLERWDGDRVVPLMSQFADERKRPELWQQFIGMPPYTPGTVPAHARAIETLRPVVIDDTAGTDLIPRDWIEAFGLKSYMVVPLIRQGQVIGVMNLDYCDRATAFQQWQIDLAMTIAGQLSLSLENARLYEELRERLRETTTLLAIGQVLSEPGDSPEVARRVARDVARAFGADMVGAYVMDAQKQELVGLAGYHVPKDLRPRLATMAMRLERFPVIVNALREGRAAWSSDPANDDRFDREWSAGLPPRSVMLVPATARGKAIGALFLVWWGVGRTFPPADTALLEAVGRQVGLALENADLARQTAAKLRETETLLAVSRALSSTLDLRSLYRHFLRRVTETLEADTVGLWMLGEDGEWLEAVAGYRVPKKVRERLRATRLSIVKEPFYAEAARTMRPVVSSDVMTDSRIPEAVRRNAPHRSQLFVPVVVNDRMIGGFAAVWWHRERIFTADELALLEAIANQAGVAMERARLFEENQRQLRELSTLYDLSRAVTGQLDRAALVEAVHAQIVRVFNARDMQMVLRDDGSDELEVVLRVQDGVRDYDVLKRHPSRSVGLSVVVIETGRAMRTDRYPEECVRQGVTALSTVLFPYWLGVPLRAGDMIMGAVALRSRERPFTEADERLLTNIGDLAALALRSASLFEERTRAYRDLAAAQDQLVRTEKLRALGEMASGVAHDFNNLLTAILGRAQLLLQRMQEPKLRQWLEVIERAALDGAQTVRRLQEFTRIRRDEPLVAVKLNDIVGDALEITQSRWRDEPQSRGVTIDVRVSLALVPDISGDAVELREALTNIILNAVDAMPQGGRLSVQSAVVGDAVSLTISDSGLGMPESVRRRIFDPFFTTKGSRGTGLGLSITYGILSRHGARIVVDSEEGRGTVFRLSFPPSPRPEPRAVTPSTSLQPGALLHCLVVDDDPAVGGVVSDMLVATGHSAVLVTDGAEAVARFAAERFDVVFTDLAMPGLSGWQVARGIKGIEPKVPVFMVTGFGVELSEAERLEHGLEAVLVKPLTIDDLLAALAQAERARARPA